MKLLFILALIPGLAYSQNNPYIFRHINREDGLAGSDVRSIMQDKKGFMWFATNNGLQKYDGYTFTTFHHIPSDSTSLSSDNLFSLLEDKQNNIWSISFIAEICRFNPVTGRCMRINTLHKEGFKELFLPKSLCRDKSGNVWIVAAHNFACYSMATNQLVFFNQAMPKGFQPNFMSAQYDELKNQLWMADGNNGICMFDIGTRQFFCYLNNPGELGIFKMKIQPLDLFIDHFENLWIHAYPGLLMRYNFSLRQLVNYNLFASPLGLVRSPAHEASSGLPPISITNMSADSQGNLWMAAGTLGLIQYVQAKDSFVLITPGSRYTNGLNFSSEIHCIYEDKEGNIWVGTDRGINVMNPTRQQFHFFENDPLSQFQGRKSETMDFYQNKAGELWVATWGSGISVYDNQFKPKRQYVHIPADSQSLAEPFNHIWSLTGADSGNVLVGCQHGYLSVSSPKPGRFTNFHVQGLHNQTIINMRSGRGDDVWMAMYWGIAKWNSKSKIGVTYDKFIPYRGVDSASGSDIYPDDQGNVWVGTLGLGLQKFDCRQDKFTEIFVPGQSNMHSISSTVINCIIPIDDSTLAIGTGTGGIDIFNTHTRQFIQVGTSEGLPSNDVSSLFFAAPYSLWATTGDMLCKIDIRNRHVTRFGPQDGIKDLDFINCRHMYQMRDGKILAGYKGGFLYFVPDRITAGGAPPDVTFTGLKIFDKPVSLDSLLDQHETLSLPYTQNFITFQYGSLSYWEGNRISYYYMLEGVDHNWVNANNQRFAAYTNLRGGKYVFKVRCENSDGLSSKAISRLMVIIRPPFWETWWFDALLLFAVLIGLYALYRYRINQLLQLQMVRNEISKDLHDDVGSTLSSISILSQVARDKMREGHQEQSSSIMTKINSYAQEMVEKMGDIVWAVNAGNESIEDIGQRLKNAFLETAGSRGIQMQFQIDPILEKRILPVQVRKNIYLICKEALNNAIKYSDCHNIIVGFKLHGSRMVIGIEDDGNGFDLRTVSRGNGLGNMRERAGEIRGEFTIDSATTGTRVNLSLAIPNSR